MHLAPTMTSPSGSGGRRLRRVLILIFAGLLTIGVLQPSTAHPGFKGGHNGPAKLWVKDTSVVEPDTGTTLAKVKIVLKAKHLANAKRGKGHRGKVKVFYKTVDGTAKADEDYTAVSGRVVIPRKNRVTYVKIPIIGDTVAEPDEHFKLLVKAKGAKVKKSVGVVTILDNDEAPPPPPVMPELSVGDDEVKEGEVAHFKVHLSAPTTTDVEFTFTTADGSAVAGKDYVETSGTGTVPAGQTWTKVAVPTLQDHLVEPTESFYLDVTGADNATVVQPRGTATIYDDDKPKLWVKNTKVDEGDTAYFKVILSQPSYKDVTFKYVTADGTAQAGLDYEKAYGEATVPAGKRYVVLPVRTIQDKLTEPDETFYLKVFDVHGAKVVDHVGKALILDDDPPKLVVRDLTVDEGKVASFEIWLSAPAPKPVTFDYVTVDAKAKAGLDYKAASGDDVVIPKGETGGTVLVETKQDLLDEFDEDFLLRLSDVQNAEVLKDRGRAVIIDDDPAPLLSIGKATAAEGTQAVLTVSLSAPSGKPVTVDWETVGGGSWGNARSGVDFTAASGSLTFLPGETTKKIKVDVLEDKVVEAEDEQFLVRLTNEKNATVAPGGRAGIVTIPANDT